MAERKIERMSIEDFLAWEQDQDRRYELVDGLPMAMTGGTNGHDRVRLRLAAAFLTQLRGRPCQAALDIKIVCATGNVRYPDVQIDCRPLGPKSSKAGEPVLVVEVLSPSTRAADFLVKLKDYESVASIETYLIFWQDEPKAAIFERVGAAFQRTRDLDGLDAVLDLAPLGLTLRFAELYDWLPAPETAELQP